MKDNNNAREDQFLRVSTRSGHEQLHLQQHNNNTVYNDRLSVRRYVCRNNAAEKAGLTWLEVHKVHLKHDTYMTITEENRVTENYQMNGAKGLRQEA